LTGHPWRIKFTTNLLGDLKFLSLIFLVGMDCRMARRVSESQKLTPLETLIMNVLWDESPAAVKQVQERLNSVKPMAYNTVLTMMRILRNKGFLASEREGKADLYRPTVTREAIGRRSLGELIDSFFSGSAEALVSQVLDGQSLSDEELLAIRAELDKTLKDRKKDQR